MTPARLLRLRGQEGEFWKRTGGEAGFWMHTITAVSPQQVASRIVAGKDLVTQKEVGANERAMEALLVLTPLALGRAARLAEAAESGALKASGANPATVRVYRVEGVANARIVIGEGGTVAIVDSGRMLFLNFGSRARAEELLARRVAQGMEGAATKSFEVPKSFLDDLRSSAVPERLARKYPGRPIEVDVSAAPDQFGLRAEQIEELRKAIIQGTGEVTK